MLPDHTVKNLDLLFGAVEELFAQVVIQWAKVHFPVHELRHKDANAQHIVALAQLNEHTKQYRLIEIHISA